MKKLLPTLTLILFVAGLASAQARWEINPYAGYRTGGGFKITDNTNLEHKIDFESGAEFGLNAAVGLTPGFYLELQYARQNTSLASNIPNENPDVPEKLNLALDYYHAAFMWQYGYDRTQPFAYFSLGWTAFYPDTDVIGTESRFSMGAGVGVKHYLSRSFGLRGQARFITTSMNEDFAGWWCGWYTCAATTSINWLTQWSFTAGVIVKFGSTGRGF